jgi:periplasmic protein TonB
MTPPHPIMLYFCTAFGHSKASILNMNLNSKAWCDIIFEGRNKDYGAFVMRRKSSKRHFFAFLIMLMFVSLLVGIPILIDRILYRSYQEENADAIVEQYQLLDAIYEEDMLPEREKPSIPIPYDETESKANAKPLIETARPEIPTITQQELQEEDPYLEELKKEEVKTDEPEKEKEIAVDNQLYTVVDEMPSFPGGEKGLMEYLSKNLRYPFAATQKKIQNQVICAFFIEKDGSVKMPTILQTSTFPLLDKEALRVVQALPKWRPARHHGKPIRVKYILPVSFRLK